MLLESTFLTQGKRKNTCIYDRTASCASKREKPQVKSLVVTIQDISMNATMANNPKSSKKQDAPEGRIETESRDFPKPGASGTWEGHLRRWIHSLGLEVTGSSLAEACKSGVLLIDLIQLLDSRQKFISINRKVNAT